MDPQLSAAEISSSDTFAYVPRKGLQTILFMGLDKYEPEEKRIGYVNDQQCDFLMVLVLDEEKQTCDVLHLNRDTMTEIRKLGIGGGVASRFTGQLALAHTYGSGGSDSCINACKAVSTLLKGVKIDHYIAMTMTGLQKLNDLLGGVEVEIPIDMQKTDPSFLKGKRVLLNGEQALRFVRARGELEDDSNLSRMDRQRTYMSAFYEKLLFTKKKNDDFVKHSLLELSSHLKSDMTVNQMSELADTVQDYTLKPFVTIDGQAVKGKKYMEFHVDEHSLNQVLISLFSES